MREIIFDTETTGLSPAGGDRMVEIGCIEMVGRVETGRHYHCYFNPGRPMPSEAEAVHGLSDIFLSDKPSFADKVEELLEFIGDSPMNMSRSSHTSWKDGLSARKRSERPCTASASLGIGRPGLK